MGHMALAEASQVRRGAEKRRQKGEIEAQPAAVCVGFGH